MSHSHNVLCRSAADYPVAQLEELVTAGWFGQEELTASVLSEDAEGHWTRVEFRTGTPDTAPPIALMRSVESADVQTSVEETLEETGSVLPEEVAAVLPAARQVIGIELRADRLDDDWWEFADVLQAGLARDLDGLVVVLGEGVYDSALQRVADLSR